MKRSKCAFGQSSLEYLGHIISDHGVLADPAKLESMSKWPRPTSIKALRGFLGLTGYYRRFVKDYGKISQPLTRLLRKDAFEWDQGAEQAFQLLKVAMTTSPVLALPDYSKEFVIECDASGVGIGAVLMQEGHPIAYISKALAPKHLGLSAYEKELLALVYAVQKWGHYLLGSHFIIRTDHLSLKYLLDQKITTLMQQKWLTKLLGYDYEIIYKSGQENRVADALSRQELQGSVALNALSVVQTDWLLPLKQAWETDPELQVIIQDLISDPLSHKHYLWQHGLLTYKDRLVVGASDSIRNAVLQEIHSSPLGGHSGTERTFKRAKRSFFWKGMKSSVIHFVTHCDVCQRNKHETVASPGLLQPLPIPEKLWTDISMDFIEGLPNSNGKSVILVVVDRLSKYAHFLPLNHPYTAIEVAQTFMNHVFRLHGMPNSIVSDRDAVFTSIFWRELFRLQGTTLGLSTAYHPQTDGQTEVVNRCLESYLRCITGERPKAWLHWLPLAEWWYNTTYHSSTKLTPYQIVYGQAPPTHIQYVPGSTTVAAVDQWGIDRESTLKMIKEHLVQAQNRMKQLADRHRTEREFLVGDWVYLRLQPYRQSSAQFRSNQKLAPKFYGPYQILQKVGSVAYKLELPSTSKLHPVFHVSLLKRKLGHAISSSTVLPPISDAGVLDPAPVAVLDRRLVKYHGRPATQILVQWEGSFPEDATWEYYAQLKAKFPDFLP